MVVPFYIHGMANVTIYRSHDYDRYQILRPLLRPIINCLEPKRGTKAQPIDDL